MIVRVFCKIKITLLRGKRYVLAHTRSMTRMEKINEFFSGACWLHQIYPAHIYVKLDYISGLLPQTAFLKKNLWPEIFGPKFV